MSQPAPRSSSARSARSPTNSSASSSAGSVQAAGPRGRRGAAPGAADLGGRHRHQPARGAPRRRDAPGRRPLGPRRVVDAVREERADRRAAGRRRRHHAHRRDLLRAAARALAFTAGLQTVTIAARGHRLQRRDRDRREGDLGDLHRQLHDGAARARRCSPRRWAPTSITTDAARAGARAPSAPRSQRPAPSRSRSRSGRCRSSARATPSITAREGALKVREAARVLGRGLRRRVLPARHRRAADGAQDHLVALTTPDDDGLVDAVSRPPQSEGIGVTRLTSRPPLPPRPRADPADGAAAAPGARGSPPSAGRTPTR